VMGPVILMMTRKMLLGIKERAERERRGPQVGLVDVTGNPATRTTPE
jgi:hypothetical protein